MLPFVHARTKVLALLVAASLLLGCKRKEDDEPDHNDAPDDVSFVEDGSDTSATENDVQLITSSLVSSSPATIGLASFTATDLGPRNIGDGANAIYFPRGCLRVETD